MKQGSENNTEATIGDVIDGAIDYAKYFFRKWYFIVPAVIVGAAGGFIVSKLVKPIYVAELTFALDDKGGSSAYAGIASQFGLDIGGEGGGLGGDNSLELIKSRTLIEQSLITPVAVNGQEELLVNRFISFYSECKDWKDNQRVAEAKFEKGAPRETYGILKDSLLKFIYKEIKKECLEVNKLDKKLNIISVKCKTEDELFSKYFAQVLVKNASDFYIDTKTKKSKTNVALLENRVDSVRRALDNEIYGAAISKDQNMNIFRAQGNVQSVRKQMNVQVLTTMYGELVKNLELAKFALMREQPLFELIDSPRLPLDQRGISKKVGIGAGAFVGLVLMLVFLAFKRRKQEQVGV